MSTDSGTSSEDSPRAGPVLCRVTVAGIVSSCMGALRERVLSLLVVEWGYRALCLRAFGVSQLTLVARKNRRYRTLANLGGDFRWNSKIFP